MKTFRQALLDAAAWLRANPERHIRGRMAVSISGEEVDPTDPSAECFCALGRIACELGRPGGYDAVSPFFGGFFKRSYEFVYVMNDNTREFRTMACRWELPGNPEVLDLLEKLAEKVSE